MVILLVVERKVLGSLWDGSDVDSVRKDICSTVSHIRVSFPGAHASQHGDLLTLCGGAFGPAQILCSAVGTADEESWEHRPPRNTWFSFRELLHLAHAAHLHRVKKNAALEQHNLGEMSRKRFQ